MVDELFDQLDILEALCASFHTGEYRVYKNVATVLRLILFGSSGDRPLFSTVVPDAKLPPLIEKPGDNSNELYFPATYLCIDGSNFFKPESLLAMHIRDGGIGRVSLGELFAYKGTWLSLQSWASQAFLHSRWTIKYFIQTVANKDGGAHVDSSRQLILMERCAHIHCHLTCKIAQDLGPLMRVQLRRLHPKFRRIVR